MATSLAKEARNTSIVGDNRVCSNGGSGKNRYGNGMPSIKGRGCPKEPLYHRCEQKREKELLQL